MYASVKAYIYTYISPSRDTEGRTQTGAEVRRDVGKVSGGMERDEGAMRGGGK